MCRPNAPSEYKHTKAHAAESIGISMDNIIRLDYPYLVLKNCRFHFEFGGFWVAIIDFFLRFTRASIFRFFTHHMNVLITVLVIGVVVKNNLQ